MQLVGAFSLPDGGEASMGRKPLLDANLSSAQGISAEAPAVQLTAPSAASFQKLICFEQHKHK